MLTFKLLVMIDQTNRRKLLFRISNYCFRARSKYSNKKQIVKAIFHNIQLRFKNTNLTFSIYLTLQSDFSLRYTTLFITFDITSLSFRIMTVCHQTYFLIFSCSLEKIISFGNPKQSMSIHDSIII